jgi:hypothetical protein
MASKIRLSTKNNGLTKIGRSSSDEVEDIEAIMSEFTIFGVTVATIIRNIGTRRVSTRKMLEV